MPKYMTARAIRERFAIACASPQADALTGMMSVSETERVAERGEIRENLNQIESHL